MKKSIATMIGAGVVLCVGAAQAAAVKTPITTEYSKVKAIDTYSGDTTVFLEQNPVGCEQGFWMRPSHPGFKENLKVIENAAHENSRVKIVGDGSDLWKQLADKNCRLDKVVAEPVANVGTKADTDGENPVDVRKEKEEEEAKAKAGLPSNPVGPR